MTTETEAVTMATELTTDKRAAMLNTMRPAIEHLGSDMLKKHRSLVSFELEAVSMKLDRFGWAQMSSAMKDRLTMDWCDVLSPYRLEEIKTACAAIMAKRPKDATNEQQVQNEINAARAVVLASCPPEPETYVPVKNKITPEAHAKLMAEYEFDGKVKVRKFTDTPKEIE